MLNLSSATRVFVALAPVDLRGSFNRLAALTQSILAQDPLSGHWFVFINRRHNRLKILLWDGSGLWVCAKRLEQGRFTWPRGEGACARLRGEELIALLTGLEVQEKSGWYRRGSERENMFKKVLVG
ncbi:MAG TPA: IS66 family insertion sequence element accessory protein TnpB [Verrucomicrobiae bacterium]